MSKEDGQKFLKGAAVLGVAAIVIKVMGAFFRIPLANLIGDEGMSYYQTAYPMYNWLIVISTAGLPAAVAKIVAEHRALGDEKGAQRVFTTMLALMTAIGLVSALAMAFSAKWVSGYVKNEGGYLSFIALAPAIFFVAVMSAFRGYFQGHQNMKPYAFSQIIEQFFRVGLGLGLAFGLYKWGLEWASAGATFGATAGSFFGCLLIVWFYFQTKKKDILIKKTNTQEPLEKRGSIIKRVLRIAIPITIGASIIPIMTMIDLFVVMRRLHDIGIVENANDLYGQLTGYAQTLVNLPQTVTAAVQISLVPAIAALATKKNRQDLLQTMETGLRLGLIIGLPCSLGLVTLAEPIMKLLYPMQIDIAENTGAILSILGWGILFLSLYQVTTGMLQGLGKPKKPALHLFMGAVLKAFLSYILVGVPSLNIKGAAIATVSAFVLASILNLIELVRSENFKPHWSKTFGKPFISGLVMVIFVKIAYKLVATGCGQFMSELSAGRLATVIAVCIGAGVFLISLFLTGAIGDEDLNMLPAGGRMKKVLNKFSKRR